MVPTNYLQLQKQAHDQNWATQKLPLGFLIVELEEYTYRQRIAIFFQKSDKEKRLSANRTPVPYGERQSAARGWSRDKGKRELCSAKA